MCHGWMPCDACRFWWWGRRLERISLSSCRSYPLIRLPNPVATGCSGRL